MLRRVFALALAGVFALTIPAAAVAQTAPTQPGWPQLQGDAAHTGARTDVPQPPYATAWAARPEASAGEHLSAPVVSGDTVVVTAPSAVLAFGLADGSVTWSVDRDAPAITPAVASLGGGDVVVYTDGRTADSSVVAALDLKTGASVWDSPVALKAESKTGMTIADSFAFVGDEGGTLYAIDLRDGTSAWTATTGGTLGGPVAVADGVVIAVVAASDSGRAAAVVGFDETTGDRTWTVTPDPSAFGSLPAVVGGAAVVAFPDGVLVGLSTDDGAEVWRQRIPALVSPLVAPAASGGSVVVGDSNGGVHLVSPTGDPGWLYEFNEPILRASPVVAGDVAVAGFEDGSIGAVSLETGHLVFRTTVTDGAVTGIALTPEAVVVARGASGRPELVRFDTDPSGTLRDEASPTRPVAADLALGLALAFVAGAVVFVPGRVVARRAPVRDASRRDEDGAGDDEEPS